MSCWLHYSPFYKLYRLLILFSLVSVHWAVGAPFCWDVFYLLARQCWFTRCICHAVGYHRYLSLFYVWLCLYDFILQVVCAYLHCPCQRSFLEDIALAPSGRNCAITPLSLSLSLGFFICLPLVWLDPCCHFLVVRSHMHWIAALSNFFTIDSLGVPSCWALTY